MGVMMISYIVWDDMQIRDERVFEWIKARAIAGEHRIKAHELALDFKCHRHTAVAILRRLENAGKIYIESHYRRGGYLCHIA
jgi:hypothetical protein